MLVLHGHTNSVQTLAYTPDGQTLISAGDDYTIHLWDLETTQSRAILRGHNNSVLGLAISPNGKHLASVGFDRKLLFWILPKGTKNPNGALEPVPGRPAAVAYSPDMTWLAVGCDDRSMRTLLVLRHGSSDEWRPPNRRDIPPVWCLSFSPDSKCLALGLATGFVQLLEMQSRAEVARFPHPSGINALAFSPDGTTLATVAGRSIRLWDIATQKLRLTLPDHRAAAWTLAYHPDGRCLATGGWDSTVRLWDPLTGIERARYDWQLGRINAVAFAPNGMTAACAGQSPDILLWDVDI